MAALLSLALLVGLDNLQVAAAVGLLPMPPGRRLRLALAFGLCEGLMPLAGLALGHGLLRALGPWPEAVEVGVLVACGAVILGLALRAPGLEEAGAAGRAERAQPAPGWLLFGLPVSLSFDNLLAGVALGTMGYPLLVSALVVGAVSTALCLLGLFAAGRVRPLFERWLPGEVGVWSGLFLVGAGLVRWWGGG